MNPILFACTELFTTGGIQRFNRNLLDAWAELGMTVDVVTLNDTSIPSNCRSRYPTIRFYCAGGSKLQWSWKLGVALCSRRRLVVCGHLHLLPIVRLFSALTGQGSRIVLILHGLEVWGRMNTVLRGSARACMRVLAVSRFTLNSFLEQVPAYPTDHSEVFPNTIGRDLAMEPKPLRLNDGRLRLLSVARLARTERDKGIRHIIDALSELGDGSVDYTVVGAGNDRDALSAYAKSRDLDVRFPGEIDDSSLWDEYRRSDVFVLPSRKEGFGIVFLEAGFFSIPVIAAAEKGASEVVKDGINGVLVEYGAVNQIQAAIERLRGDRSIREQMGAAGRALVTEGGEYSFDALIKRTKLLLT